MATYASFGVNWALFIPTSASAENSACSLELKSPVTNAWEFCAVESLCDEIYLFHWNISACWKQRTQRGVQITCFAIDLRTRLDVARGVCQFRIILLLHPSLLVWVLSIIQNVDCTRQLKLNAQIFDTKPGVITSEDCMPCMPCLPMIGAAEHHYELLTAGCDVPHCCQQWCEVKWLSPRGRHNGCNTEAIACITGLTVSNKYADQTMCFKSSPVRRTPGGRVALLAASAVALTISRLSL